MGPRVARRGILDVGEQADYNDDRSRVKHVLLLVTRPQGDQAQIFATMSERLGPGDVGPYARRVVTSVLVAFAQPDDHRARRLGSAEDVRWSL